MRQLKRCWSDAVNPECHARMLSVIRVFHDAAPLGAGLNRRDVEVRFPLARKAFLTLTHDAALIEKLTHASGAKRSRLLEAVPEVRIRRMSDSEVRVLNSSLR